jgi:hypothetical protein
MKEKDNLGMFEIEFIPTSEGLLLIKIDQRNEPPVEYGFIPGK